MMYDKPCLADAPCRDCPRCDNEAKLQKALAELNGTDVREIEEWEVFGD